MKHYPINNCLQVLNKKSISRSQFCCVPSCLWPPVTHSTATVAWKSNAQFFFCQCSLSLNFTLKLIQFNFPFSYCKIGTRIREVNTVFRYKKKKCFHLLSCALKAMMLQERNRFASFWGNAGRLLTMISHKQCPYVFPTNHELRK